MQMQLIERQRNRRIVTAFLLVCAMTLVVVSTLPPVLMPPAFSKLLAFASLGTALVALLVRERMFAGHLTYWDKAAALVALSLAAGLFTDAAAVTGYLESLSTDAPAPDPSAAS